MTASTLPSQFFQIDDNTNQNELRLFFNTPLTMTGTTLNPTQSFEHEPSGGNRFFAGAITAAASMPIATAAPEPATWGMMIGGVGVAGAALRRRRQVTTRVSYAI